MARRTRLRHTDAIGPRVPTCFAFFLIISLKNVMAVLRGCSSRLIDGGSGRLIFSLLPACYHHKTVQSCLGICASLWNHSLQMRFSFINS